MIAQLYTIESPTDDDAADLRLFDGNDRIADLAISDATVQAADMALHRLNLRRKGKWSHTEWGYEATVRFQP